MTNNKKIIFTLSTLLLTASVSFASGYYDNCNCDNVYSYLNGTTNAPVAYNYNNGYYNNYNYNNNGYYNNYAPSIMVSTNAVASVYANGAIINGYVTVNNYNNNVYGSTYFQYGANSNSLNLTTSAMNFSNSTGFNASLNNLNCGTTYYYRAVANLNGNVQYGQILSFTTSACPVYQNQYQNYQNYSVPQYKTNYYNKIKKVHHYAKSCY